MKKVAIIMGSDSDLGVCKKAIDISLGFELAHVGINCDGEQNAISIAETISNLFRMSPRHMNSAVFSGTAIEAVKSKGWGENGHVGFFTNSIPRAMAYFRALDVAINEDSFKYNKNGEISCFYLKDDIGGFAFHLVER